MEKYYRKFPSQSSFMYEYEFLRNEAKALTHSVLIVISSHSVETKILFKKSAKWKMKWMNWYQFTKKRGKICHKVCGRIFVRFLLNFFDVQRGEVILKGETGKASIMREWKIAFIKRKRLVLSVLEKRKKLLLSHKNLVCSWHWMFPSLLSCISINRRISSSEEGSCCGRENTCRIFFLSLKTLLNSFQHVQSLTELFWFYTSMNNFWKVQETNQETKWKYFN